MHSFDPSRSAGGFPLPPSHPLAALAGNPHTGFPGAAPPAFPQPASGPANFASSSPPPPDFAAQEQQLLTLERLDAHIQRVRNQGGPAKGLEAVLKQPLQVSGRFTLYPLTTSVLIFLTAIKSPLALDTGGNVNAIDIARALLGFLSPETSAEYLNFDDEIITADMPRVSRDAYALAAALTPDQVETATHWIMMQMGGVQALMPEDASPLAEAAREAEATPPPAPQDGSL